LIEHSIKVIQFPNEFLGLNLIQGDALADNWLQHPLSNMPSWFIGDSRMNEILKNTGSTPQDADGGPHTYTSFVFREYPKTSPIDFEDTYQRFNILVLE